jgi:hypothetical protein
MRVRSGGLEFACENCECRFSGSERDAIAPTAPQPYNHQLKLAGDGPV